MTFAPPWQSTKAEHSLQITNCSDVCPCLQVHGPCHVMCMSAELSIVHRDSELFRRPKRSVLFDGGSDADERKIPVLYSSLV